jgi:hypothetical protein
MIVAHLLDMDGVSVSPFERLGKRDCSEFRKKKWPTPWVVAVRPAKVACGGEVGKRKY